MVISSGRKGLFNQRQVTETGGIGDDMEKRPREEKGWTLEQNVR